jgi:transcriptional regulator GlxA family with amidase domain
MGAHLHESLDVGQLAARVAISERPSHRRFTAGVGATLARLIETLRLERVRVLLEAGRPLKEIAAQTGFASAAQLSKAFERRFGIGPRLFRQTRAGTGSADR